MRSNGFWYFSGIQDIQNKRMFLNFMFNYEDDDDKVSKLIVPKLSLQNLNTCGYPNLLIVKYIRDTYFCSYYDVVRYIKSFICSDMKFLTFTYIIIVDNLLQFVKLI